MNNFLTPKEIAASFVVSGRNKAALSVARMVILSIYAGAFIGFGSYAFTVATAITGTGFEVTLAKFLGAGVFPVGLMLVVFFGAELFTSNTLMTISLFEKEITMSQMLKNWVFVYLGNFIGSVALALLLSKSGLYGEAMTAKAIAISEAKVAIPLIAVIIRGTFCNVFVVLAAWMQTGAKDITGKIFAIWFPIMFFVLAGYEHSVANMFFMPMGLFLGADITWGQILLNNILPVTIGNIIGGGILIPAVAYCAYLKKD